MDPTHHEKIVDKLMQYRGKIPKDGHLADKQAQWRCRDLRKHIDYLIEDIEQFALELNKELIK